MSKKPGLKSRDFKTFKDIFDDVSWILILVSFVISLVFIRFKDKSNGEWQHTLGIIGGYLMQGVQDMTYGCPKR